MFRVQDVLDPFKVAKDELGKVYDCDICDCGDWHSETEVEIHRRVAHKKELMDMITNEYSCMICGHQSDSDEDLLKHLKTAHFYSSGEARRIERDIFICDYCHNVFFNKHLLAVHIMHKHRIYVNMGSLTCPLCPKKMKPQQAYSHMSVRHQFQSISICPVCMTKRPNRAELAKHMNTHNKYYHCTICGYMATKEKDFNQHVETYRKKQEAPVKSYAHCFRPPLNTTRFKTRIAYMRIRPALMGLVVPDNFHICILCREICNESQMKEHIARDHSSPKEVVQKARHRCACGEEFLNAILLKYHVFKLKGHHRVLGKDESPSRPDDDKINDEESYIVIVPDTSDSEETTYTSAEEIRQILELDNARSSAAIKKEEKSVE